MTDKKASQSDKLSVDAEAVRELAALLEETGLSEIEIEKGGTRLRVARHSAAAQSIAVAAQPAPATAKDTTPGEPAKRGTTVTSPMVGTVYLGPQPGSPPFVKVGDVVKDGTLCIIEAMKTMNPVAAPTAGKIVEIFVRDGQPVEFGEPLMRID